MFETKRMKMCKIFVVLSLMLTGSGVCFGAFKFLEEQQHDEFDNQVCQVIRVLQQRA